MQNQKAKTGKILFYTIGILIVVVMLIYILLPRIPDERVISKVAICRSNLKQFALAIKLYANDNDDRLPPHEKWNELLTPYLPDYKKIICPTEKKKDDKICTFILNKNLKNRMSLNNRMSKVPEDMVILFEGPTGWNQSGGPEMIVFRHGKKEKKCSVALADGTIIQVNETEAKKLKWKP